ncbi:hypothetical protein WICPIJ_009551 [Wickerhamomyces pijperi]|uniref:Uncharacterized protein n=1 Tax=Wickerhamomyces pijperi TaxID=599730 RepID=A0A9P8PLT6_WICPI|nr:hypothetical protein WICPIJ_009551 [Wickerhamomyces pijperi]
MTDQASVLFKEPLNLWTSLANKRFLDGLSIGSWVGNNDQSWFLERTGDVVGEVTWGESTGNGGGTSVSSVLQDSSLTEGSGRDSNNVSWVWNSSNNSSS